MTTLLRFTDGSSVLVVLAGISMAIAPSAAAQEVGLQEAAITFRVDGADGSATGDGSSMALTRQSHEYRRCEAFVSSVMPAKAGIQAREAARERCAVRR